MKKQKQLLLILFGVLIFTTQVDAQYASREVSKRQQAYIDSLKQVEYNYLFPILGQKAYEKGFDIPYPAGAMGNFIWMDQGILIDNFQLGLTGNGFDIPLTNIDEFMEWGRNTNTSYAVNFRPDIWIFPFLNVYGLFGYGSSTTEIELTKPVPLSTSVTQGLSTAGFGIMTGFGIGKYWTAIDANWTWTKPELLEDPVLAKVLGIRLGRTFSYSSKPDRNVAFWIGGMRARMAAETLGNISMGEALPPDFFERVDQIEQQYNQWYDGLSPSKKQLVDNSRLPDIMESITSWNGETVVTYAFDKAPKQEWNMLIGGQFQFNKRWMFRSEVGLVGDRKSFLVSVNYRFLI